MRFQPSSTLLYFDMDKCVCLYARTLVCLVTWLELQQQ